MKNKGKADKAACCSHGSEQTDDAMKMFAAFLGSAMKPGALDVVTKEYIAMALGLAVHCVPCATLHINKAKSMGIGAQEMEEAAALTVAFGGCRALMLWNELKKELL